MTTYDLEYWLTQAAPLSPENPLNIPYPVALTEAAVAAKFVDDHWEGDGHRPGLNRFAARLPKVTADEIRSLIVAVQWQQTKVVLMVGPTAAEFGPEADELVDELEATIGFVLDDGVDDEADAQFEQIKQYHAQDGRRPSVVAQALRDYATLGESLQVRILALDTGFDVGIFARARELADKLALAPSHAISPSDQERERADRNRLLGLLMQKVSLVRATAAHAFRKSPETVRKVTSAYERRRRANARKAGAEKPAPDPTPAPDPNPVLE